MPRRVLAVALVAVFVSCVSIRSNYDASRSTCVQSTELNTGKLAIRAERTPTTPWAVSLACTDTPEHCSRCMRCTGSFGVRETCPRPDGTIAFDPESFRRFLEQGPETTCVIGGLQYDGALWSSLVGRARALAWRLDGPVPEECVGFLPNPSYVTYDKFDDDCEIHAPGVGASPAMTLDVADPAKITVFAGNDPTCLECVNSDERFTVCSPLSVADAKRIVDPPDTECRTSRGKVIVVPMAEFRARMRLLVTAAAAPRPAQCKDPVTRRKSP